MFEDDKVSPDQQKYNVAVATLTLLKDQVKQVLNVSTLWSTVEKVQCKSVNTFRDQIVKSVNPEQVQVVTLLQTKVLKVLTLWSTM